MTKSEKFERITADLDAKGRVPIEWKLKWAKFIFSIYGYKDLEARVSSSGKGRHLIGWRLKGVSREKMLKIRKLAGDDKKRVFLDSTGAGRGKRQPNVLFTTKTVTHPKSVPFIK